MKREGKSKQASSRAGHKSRRDFSNILLRIASCVCWRVMALSVGTALLTGGLSALTASRSEPLDSKRVTIN